jgi:hypothetical protein
MLSVSLCCEILMPSHSNRPNPHRQNLSHQFRDLVPTGFNELCSQGLFPYRVQTRFLPRELHQPFVCIVRADPYHYDIRPVRNPQMRRSGFRLRACRNDGTAHSRFVCGYPRSVLFPDFLSQETKKSLCAFAPLRETFWLRLSALDTLAHFT